MPHSRRPLSPASSNWWNNYVGIPFKWNGSTREGASCGGLVCLVSDFAATGVQVNLADVRAGDVLHMWGFYKGKRRATHCGVVTEPGFVLHAEEVVGSCISRYKGDNRFLQRVIGAYGLE